MKEIYVLTWDDEYVGVLKDFKAYPTKEAAEEAVNKYLGQFDPEYQEIILSQENGLPKIHKLEICL